MISGQSKIDILLLLVCLLSHPSYEKDTTPEGYQITPLQHNPGLYYEKIDQIRLINKSWRLMITLDVQYLIGQSLPGLKIVQEQFQACIKIQANQTCTSQLRLNTIGDLARELESTQNHMHNILQNPSHNSTRLNRKVRAPLLGFIGTISRKIFGTMDYNDHEHITNEINRLYEDQRQITHLIGNSTHIIQAEIHHVKELQTKNHQNLRKMELKLEKAINETTHSFASLSNLEYLDFIRNIGLEAEYAARKYVESANKIIQAMEDAKHGKINPVLLNNKQILHAIEEIEKTETSSIFPILKNKLDMALLTQICAIETAYNKGRFLVTIIIPLLSRDQMDLYKMIPCKVPQIVQQTRKVATYINPRKDYIAISKLTSRYGLVDKSYIQQCIPLENCLACSKGAPLWKSTTKSCEYQLFINNELQPDQEIYRSCDVRITNDLTASWEKLTATEGWIFSTMTSEPIEISCEGRSPVTKILNGTGVLSLKEHCTAETSSVSLEGVTSVESSLPIIHGTPITLNITKLVPVLSKPLKIQNFITGTLQQALPDEDRPDLFDQSMQETINTAENIGLHHQEQYHHKILTTVNCSITGLLTVGLGFTLTLMYKKGLIARSLNRCCRQKQRHTKPGVIRRQQQRANIQRIYEVPISTIQVPALPPPPPPTSSETTATIQLPEIVSTEVFRLRNY